MLALKRSLGIALLGVVVGMALVSCGHSEGPDADKPEQSAESQTAVTSFYPLTYFAERIGGGQVDVVCPVSNDADPATWHPSSNDIRLMQQATVVFVNGASFESWVVTAPLTRSRLVDTSRSFADKYLKYETATTHSHGPAGSHSHEGIDGHTWLDPVLALQQAHAVHEGLKRAFPQSASQFDTGFAQLERDLRDLDQDLRKLNDEMQKVILMANHPAYNYLARRYDWSLKNFDFAPDEPISAEQTEQLRSIDSDELAGRTRIMLWESMPIVANIEAVREQVGAESIVFDPCESGSDQGDFITRMQQNIERLRAAIADGG